VTEEKLGRLRRLTGTISKVLRLARRAYHQRTGAQRLNLEDIEHRIHCTLYRRTAVNLGLDVHEMGRVLCIQGHGKLFRVCGCTTEFDSFPVASMTEDKEYIRTLFQERGLSVPQGSAFDWRDERKGIEFALSLKRPCVVKPASDTSGGKGVTTSVNTRSEIAGAFRFAGLFAPKVLIEEFIPGDNYRFLIYKGKCLSVGRRELPSVTGDGVSTVRELVEKENCNRIHSSEWQPGDAMWMPLPTNAAALRVLKGQGLDWSSVPKPAEAVYLGEVANLGFGCTYSEVLGMTHPDQIRAAERAVEIIGMTIAGVDIIAPDIKAPGYHVLEINASPGWVVHYMIRNSQEMRDPIRTILADYFDIDVGVKAEKHLAVAR
jgi:cyanophycin synthetase